jgi:hypothetical protein
MPFINTGKDLISLSTVTRIFAQEIQDPAWTPSDLVRRPRLVWVVTAERSDSKPPIHIASVDPELVDGVDNQKAWAQHAYERVVASLEAKYEVIDMPRIELFALDKYISGLKGSDIDKPKKSDIVEPTATGIQLGDGSAAPLTTKTIQEESGTVPDGEKIPDGFYTGVVPAEEEGRVGLTSSGQTAVQELAKHDEANEEEHENSGDDSRSAKRRREKATTTTP